MFVVSNLVCLARARFFPRKGIRNTTTKHWSVWKNRSHVTIDVDGHVQVVQLLQVYVACCVLRLFFFKRVDTFRFLPKPDLLFSLGLQMN
jgi:hypothetical protein